MLNPRRKRRPSQNQIREVLLSTARLMLESEQCKVPIADFNDKSSGGKLGTGAGQKSRDDQPK
ncbi:hypothetical protein ACPUEJ_24455 (plasmid) [Vibrio tubiashii]|uniref:hypothetical protein n=1 Tax=Vibrio tubiashii TaxID=29498 RepID=UPI003CE47B0F